jgi:hypothetical protein
MNRHTTSAPGLASVTRIGDAPVIHLASARRDNAADTLSPAAVAACHTAVDATLERLGLALDSTLALALSGHLALLWRDGAVYARNNETPKAGA